MNNIVDFGDFGNYGIILLIIAGIIIVTIAIFFICRELVCWYWKINRLVILMEEQNSILKELLSKNNVTGFKELSGKNYVTTDRQRADFIPTHRVKLLAATNGLNLRKEPKPDAKPFIKLPNGTEVQFLRIGNMVEFQGINAPWFEIRTKDGIFGWCFSGNLVKR